MENPVQISVLTITKKIATQMRHSNLNRQELIDGVNNGTITPIGWVLGSLINPRRPAYNYIVIEKDGNYTLYGYLRMGDPSKIVGRPLTQIFIS